MVTSKENNSTEITDNSRSSVNISEVNLSNIVNNTREKNENPFGTLLEPSGPSEPSVKVLGESSAAIIQQTQQVSKSIYRLGHSDSWACKNCRQKGDKWYMRQHLCRGSR